MDLIALTDTIEADLDTLDLPGHYVEKYVSPYPLSADRSPILAVYPSGTEEPVLLSTGEVVHETATFHVVWAESVATNLDAGRPADAERTRLALQRAETILSRLLTYSAGFPAEEAVWSDVSAAEYGRTEGVLWRAEFTLTIRQDR